MHASALNDLRVECVSAHMAVVGWRRPKRCHKSRGSAVPILNTMTHKENIPMA
jgi:hypothetical protein